MLESETFSSHEDCQGLKFDIAYLTLKGLIELYRERNPRLSSDITSDMKNILESIYTALYPSELDNGQGFTDETDGKIIEAYFRKRLSEVVKGYGNQFYPAGVVRPNLNDLTIKELKERYQSSLQKNEDLKSLLKQIKRLAREGSDDGAVTLPCGCMQFECDCEPG